jgi:hypothetical protein
VAEAIGLYEHALALDPGSVEAQGGLADTLVGRALLSRPRLGRCRTSNAPKA